MFESYENFPGYLPLRDSLQQHWRTIAQEAQALLQVQGAYAAWPERGIYHGQWDVFGIRWQNQWLPSAAQAPHTTALLQPFENLLVNAGFSLMLPRTHITPHHGYTQQVLRTHLGLVVPPVTHDRLALRVGQAVRTWHEGSWLLFDDTLEHEAWNQSDQLRIVLLMDLWRPSSGGPRH